MLGPLLLIVIGVLFLLNNMYPGFFRFSKMWPVILIVIGLVKVLEYFQRGLPHDRENVDIQKVDIEKEGE